MKIRFHIGSDISSNVLDFCVLDRGEIVLEEQIENTAKGLRKLIKKLRSLGLTNSNSWFCAEHTGVYGNTLRTTLEKHECVYSMVPANEIKRSIGLVRGKNDKIDARRIAQYCKRFHDKLKPSRLPDQYLLELKQLFIFRKLQIKNRTRAKNYLKSLEKSWESSPQKSIMKEIKKQIKGIDKLVEKLEYQIRELIRSDPEAEQNYKLIRSVPGIGQISACYMLICTENFHLFDDARKFASYTGVAPFEHTSGKSVVGTTKTSVLRNKAMKTLLYNGMSSIITTASKNELATYYRKRIAEGKHKNKVKNALVFKMITRAFAAVKRQSPYIQVDKFRNAA